jgi:hypothetical protein
LNAILKCVIKAGIFSVDGVLVVVDGRCRRVAREIELTGDRLGPTGVGEMEVRRARGEFPEPFIDPAPSSDTRILFEGVDESTRPLHRLDRFDVGVEVELGVAAAVLDLGRYAISRT